MAQFRTLPGRKFSLAVPKRTLGFLMRSASTYWPLEGFWNQSIQATAKFGGPRGGRPATRVIGSHHKESGNDLAPSVARELSARSVGIFVCSRGHSRNLERLVTALVSQRVPKGWSFHSVTVVWNSKNSPTNYRPGQIVHPTGKHPIVREFTEPRLGIPYARNRSLDIAGDYGVTHLAFIDDDCLPHRHWLENLLGKLDEKGADVAAGGWIITAAGKPSPWLPESVFGTKRYYFSGNSARDGDELPTAFTRNVVFATSLLSHLPGEHRRFPETMTATGGSDALFFSRMRMAGARIIYAEDAKVYETYESSRLTLRWNILRRIRNTQVRLRRRQETRESLAEPKVVATTLALALLATPASMVLLPLTPFLRDARRLIGSVLLVIAPLLGALLWGLGIEYQEYAGRFRFRTRQPSLDQGKEDGIPDTQACEGHQ